MTTIPWTITPSHAAFTLNNGAALGYSLDADGDAIHCDGVNDYGVLAHAAGMATAGDTMLTAELLLYFPTIPGGVVFIGGQGNSASNPGSAWDVYTSVGNIFFDINGGAGQSLASFPLSTFKAGRHYHIIFTAKLDGTSVPKVWINEVEPTYGSQITYSGTVAASANMSIGADLAGALPANILAKITRVARNHYADAAGVSEAYDTYQTYFESFTGSEDHLYLCGDAASPAVDSVGGAAFNLTAVSSPTFNGAVAGTITLHKATTDRLTTTAKLFDTSGDFSGHFKGKLPLVISALERLLSHSVNTVGPTVDLYESASNLFVDVYSQVSAGFAVATINTGALAATIDPTTVWGIAFAYKNDTKTMIARVKSSTGINVADSDVGTVNPAYAAGTYKVGCSAADASGTDIILDQFGVKNGIAYTDAQLSAALDELLSLDANGVLPDVFGPVMPKVINSILG